MTITHAPERSSLAIREQLGHPVIDGDGHYLEIRPVLLEFIDAVAGPKMVERYLAMIGSRPYDLSVDDRRHRRMMRPPFWIAPTANTLDRATATLPALLRSRMDEFGIDYSILYPTEGLLLHVLDDAEMRCAVMRAMNKMNAELFGPHADRLTPAALIPMHTPGEAIAELDHAVGELGLKTVMIVSTIRRPMPGADPLTGPAPYWIDPIALDSAHDYDPVWQRCLDLGVAPTDHGSSMGWVNRSSPSNYMYNHIGHFAAAGEAFCKALFFGGVTRRFPALKFAFLECGVGWACMLYSDLIGHWEKRNFDALVENLDPAKLDQSAFIELIRAHGDARTRSKIDDLNGEHMFDLWAGAAQRSKAGSADAANRGDLDEWAACKIESVDDIRDLFVPNFFFGCEADDRMTAWAFNQKLNPLGARLNAIFSSDIGHWDVQDARDVLVDAYSLVDDGILTGDDFRDFVFANPVALHTSANPAFFDGTAVHEAVTNQRDVVEKGTA